MSVLVSYVHINRTERYLVLDHSETGQILLSQLLIHTTASEADPDILDETISDYLLYQFPLKKESGRRTRPMLRPSI